MYNKVSWGGWSVFKAFFSNVLNVNMIDAKKCGVFTYVSEEEIENFLLSSLSYVYVNMILQVFWISVPASCVKDLTDEASLSFKIKLDPDLLSLHLDNFKIIVETQCLYEPITISLQHYFFNPETLNELSVFYLSND